MNLLNRFTKRKNDGKRIGITAVVFAVAAIAKATSTLKTYVEQKKKK